MPIAYDPSATTEYVLACDRDTPKPTRFKLSHLTARQLAAIQDSARVVAPGPDGVVALRSLNIEGMYADACEAALVGWTDFYDATGSPVAFKRGPAAIARLMPAWVAEIGKEVLRLNVLTEDEEKNSSSAPGS